MLQQIESKGFEATESREVLQAVIGANKVAIANLHIEEDTGATYYDLRVIKRNELTVLEDGLASGEIMNGEELSFTMYAAQPDHDEQQAIAQLFAEALAQ